MWTGNSGKEILNKKTVINKKFLNVSSLNFNIIYCNNDKTHRK